MTQSSNSADTTDDGAPTPSLKAQATELGSGIGWIEPAPFSDITGFTGDREIYDQSVGAAGAGLVFLCSGGSLNHTSGRKNSDRFFHRSDGGGSRCLSVEFPA